MICSRCSLCKTRRQIVKPSTTSTVPPKTDVLLLGEAPGRSEELRGEPFIGPSGKLLHEIMEDAGWYSLGLSHTIANTVWCRPCDSKLGPNRAPTKEEIAACYPHTMELLRSSNPRLVVTIGDVARRTFAKVHHTMGHILHPAFLLRKGGKSCIYYEQTVETLYNLAKEVFGA